MFSLYMPLIYSYSVAYIALFTLTCLYLFKLTYLYLSMFSLYYYIYELDKIDKIWEI